MSTRGSEAMLLELAGLEVPRHQRGGVAAAAVVEERAAVLAIEAADLLVAGRGQRGGVVGADRKQRLPTSSVGGAQDVEPARGRELDRGARAQVVIGGEGEELGVGGDQALLPGLEIERVELRQRDHLLAHADQRPPRIARGQLLELDGGGVELGEIALLAGRDVDAVEVPVLVAVLVLRIDHVPAVERPAVHDDAAHVARLDAAAGPPRQRLPRRRIGGGREEEVGDAVDGTEIRDPLAVRRELRCVVARAGEERRERNEWIGLGRDRGVVGRRRRCRRLTGRARDAERERDGIGDEP